jgi:hypothetical protein
MKAVGSLECWNLRTGKLQPVKCDIKEDLIKARVIKALNTRSQVAEDRLEDVISEQELEIYRAIAAELTADRTTNGLPVAVAQGIFVMSFAISYSQTFAAPDGPGNWWAIEIHSIGKCNEHSDFLDGIC